MAENSTESISEVIAIHQRTNRVVVRTFSNSLGEFTLNGLKDEPHTIVGIDQNNEWASDATACIPKELTWENSSPQSFNVGLSSSNVTITGNTVENTGADNDDDVVISNLYHNWDGKFYVEVEIDALVGDIAIGFGTDDIGGSALGEDLLGTASFGWYSNGDLKVAGVVVDTIMGFQEGDICCMFFKDGKFWFKRIRNGAATLTGAIGDNDNLHTSFATGIDWHMACTLRDIGDKVIFRTLASEQKHPSLGFLPWDSRGETI